MDKFDSTVSRFLFIGFLILIAVGAIAGFNYVSSLKKDYIFSQEELNFRDTLSFRCAIASVLKENRNCDLRQKNALNVLEEDFANIKKTFKQIDFQNAKNESDKKWKILEILRNEINSKTDTKTKEKPKKDSKNTRLDGVYIKADSFTDTIEIKKGNVYINSKTRVATVNN